MKRIAILAVVLLALMLVQNIFAAVSSPQLSQISKAINAPPLSDKNPQWVNTTYYTINETYMLNLTRRYGPFPLETVRIYYVENITQNSLLPPGFNWQDGLRLPSLDGYVNASGNWTPTRCQGSPVSYMSYRFKLCYNHSANPFPGCADTEWVNISVRDKNRAPVLTGVPNLLNNLIYVPAGSNVHYEVQATDPDMTECGNNNVTTTCSLTPAVTGYSFNYANGQGTFDWNPQQVDIGQHILRFNASDSYYPLTPTFLGLFDEKAISINVYNPFEEYNASENQSLTFSIGMNSSNSSLEISIQPQSLPAGAAMPQVTGNSQIQTTFNWIPNHCQGSNSYGFSTMHYVNSVLTYTKAYTVNVANVNRAPAFTSVVPTTQTINAGNQFVLDLEATDPDMVECADDALTIGYSSIPAIPSASFNDGGNGNAIFSWMPSINQTGNYTLTFTATDTHGSFVSKQTVLSVTGPSYVCGDADGSGIITISDAVFLINYIFAGGAAPNPLESGNVNNDGIISISDAVYLINYIFSGGPAPVCSQAFGTSTKASPDDWAIINQ